MPSGSAFLCEAEGCEARLVSYSETHVGQTLEIMAAARRHGWDIALRRPILCAKHVGTNPKLARFHCYGCGVALKDGETRCERCR